MTARLTISAAALGISTARDETDLPPCTGLSWMFDSTNPTIHKEAAKICHSCDLIDWCRDQLARAQHDALRGRHCAPSGTWAGTLYNDRGQAVTHLYRRRR